MNPGLARQIHILWWFDYINNSPARSCGRFGRLSASVVGPRNPGHDHAEDAAKNCQQRGIARYHAVGKRMGVR